MRRVLPKGKRIRRERTPRFIYLVAFLALTSWAGWGYLLFSVSPSGLTGQALFLISAFFGLLFTLTFLLYEGASIFTGRDPHKIFIAAIRRAFFIALFATFAGAMKLLEVVNLLNLTLFGLILLLTEIQLSRGQGDKKEKPDSK
jgi:hypothetical protein